jgi:hypothetical protein
MTQPTIIEIDGQLHVPPDVKNLYDEAYTYDTASPMQWLESELQLLWTGVCNKKIIVVQSGDGNLTLRSRAEFKEWVELYYPQFSPIIFSNEAD